MKGVRNSGRLSRVCLAVVVCAAAYSPRPGLAQDQTPLVDPPGGFSVLKLPGTNAAVADETSSGGVTYERTVTPSSKFSAETPVTLTFSLSPQDAQAGETVTLTIRMQLEEGWHSFGLTKASPDQVGLPTTITIDPAADTRSRRQIAAEPVAVHNLTPIGDLVESPAPTLYGGTDNAHFGEVTWTQTFKVVGSGDYGIKGVLKYSICDKSLCKPPKTVPFELGVVPADIVRSAAADLATADIPPGRPVPAAADVGEAIEIADFELVEAAQSNSLIVNLLFAFLGGLLLNVMPCVLPVIAIKVLSFVQQAGESRRRILALNVTYACGVVTVFVVLAALAVFLGQGWGGLFQNQEFNLLMAAFVFAMGLSLLGVFEIPVPGMVGSSAGGAHREGLLGAFATGIFATLLATPCTGPFMGTTLAWSVKQAPAIVFLVWGVMGIGMTSPYLLIGAFPKLVNWLPRPGMWMVRFKEFAGFVLMGAVVWLVSSLHAEMLIPALIIFVGIALGLWMVGNLYDTTSQVRHKWTVRVLAAVLSTVVIGFGWRLHYRSSHVDWEEFSTARVEELRRSGAPILIDFTADWCTNCKTNEAIALDRPETAAFFEQHGITAIKADYSDYSPEIERWLELARQEGVPLTLIFPKGQPKRAIPLRGVYSQSQLLATLKRAVGANPAETTAVDVAPAPASGAAATIAAPSAGPIAR